MSCEHCREGLGTNYFIHGAVPAHDTADHWRIVTAHGAAKDILRGLVELVGAEAVVRHVAQVGHGDDTTRRLKALFKELGK